MKISTVKHENLDNSKTLDSPDNGFQNNEPMKIQKFTILQ